MRGEVLVPRGGEGMGRGLMLAEGDESTGGAGGMIEVRGGKSVVEGKDRSLLNFLGQLFEPRRGALPNFGVESLERRDRPTMNFGEEFGVGGLVEPGEVVGLKGDPAFVPLA